MKSGVVLPGENTEITNNFPRQEEPEIKSSFLKTRLRRLNPAAEKD